LAALGVVYGDIGTSPLYAMKEAFAGTHAIPLSPRNVFAVLSMMFWAVTLTVSLKYVTFMLRYDHRGEGECWRCSHLPCEPQKDAGALPPS
jgi:KUP system potassium uptake protein